MPGGFVNLTQTRVIWLDGISLEKLSPLDWPVGILGVTDDLCVHQGCCHPGTGSLKRHKKKKITEQARGNMLINPFIFKLVLANVLPQQQKTKTKESSCLALDPIGLSSDFCKKRNVYFKSIPCARGWHGSMCGRIEGAVEPGR